MTELDAGTLRTSAAHPWQTAAVGVLVVLGTVAAWLHRFVQDTAFVSFQYARSLVEGTGLTWFGQRVEGYTNFLWILWIGLGLELGVGAISWAYIGGLASFVAACLGLWRLGRTVFDNAWTPVIAVAIFATNWSAICFATGGIETMAQTALLTWAVALALDIYYRSDYPPRLPLVLSLLFTLALMIRFDSAVVIAPTVLIAIAGVSRAGREEAGYIELIGPTLLVIAGWMAWRYGFYGRVVPNTFYAWIDPTLAMVGNGVPYVARFATWYLYGPIALLALLVSSIWKIRMAPRLGMVLVLALAWLIYIVLIGGDYMEFRLMVPVLPLIALGIAWSIEAIAAAVRVGQWPIRILSVLLLVTASIVHGLDFTRATDDGTLDSVPLLASGRGIYPDGSWGRIATRLGRDLAGTGAVVAAQEPGAIAWYSRLQTIDVWGLNDLDIATQGMRVPPSFTRPGHRRHATLAWLLHERATFVLGPVTIVPPGMISDDRNLPSLQKWIESAIPFGTEPLEHAMVVAMPLNAHESLMMWYLTPSRRITERMREKRWEIREVRFEEGER